jgi:hypothetical protein
MESEETKWLCPFNDLNGFPTLWSTVWPSAFKISSLSFKSSFQTIRDLSLDPETRTGFPEVSCPQTKLVTHPLWPKSKELLEKVVYLLGILGIQPKLWCLWCRSYCILK